VRALDPDPKWQKRYDDPKEVTERDFWARA
jgi:hypothetical protein